MKHTIKVTTKRKAMALVTESLFKPVNGRTLNYGRYCSGKYRVDQEIPYVGREETVPEHIKALWVEKRKDKDGPYIAIFCVYEGRESANV